MAARVPHDPTEGEYTDSDLPPDAEVPKDDEGLVDDRSGTEDVDAVVIEEVEIVEIDRNPDAMR
ncbi:hypothetical protein [Agromyces sp. GXQ0307]|uniref:hypothetical protein n=1 Tax=Agromyces sp. GXQ0307 TaxID=3377835 RepID=UPI00383BEA8E